MIPVEGGRVPSGSPQGWIDDEVGSFFISKYEISWAEWKEVRSWAQAKGYDIGYFGRGADENFPVNSANWYDAVKWCNAKSEMEGLIPYYSLDGETFRTGEIEAADSQFVDITKTHSNGYRLPSAAEWQWAARGGLKSQGYTYSGSNNEAEVSKDSVLGANLANELGLHDMSGNVAEWVADRGYGNGRIICGVSSDYLIAGSYKPLDAEVGFRIARNTPVYKPPSGSTAPANPTSIGEGAITSASSGKIQKSKKGGGKPSAKKSSGSASKKSAASKPAGSKKSGGKKKKK